MNAETNGHASKRGAKVFLSPQERYQLTRWLDTNWKEIEESKQPMREALATAKAALGVPQLTLGHFQTALAGIGKSWPTGPGRGDKHAARTLARAIITLYEQLDVEIPPDLAALAVRH